MANRLEKALRVNTDLVRRSRHETNVMQGTFVAKLSDLQKLLDGLPDNAECTALQLNDAREYKHMPAEWRTEIFCDRLAKAPAVATLELAGVGLDDAFAARFAEVVLPSAPALREVNLGRNAIGPAGVMAIAAALPKSKLEVLRLNAQSKACGAEAEEAMAQAAAECETLTKLNVDFKSANHRSSCEHSLMRNADAARKQRQAAKAAAAAAAANGDGASAETS